MGRVREPLAGSADRPEITLRRERRDRKWLSWSWPVEPWLLRGEGGGVGLSLCGLPARDALTGRARLVECCFVLVSFMRGVTKETRLRIALGPGDFAPPGVDDLSVYPLAAVLLDCRKPISPWPRNLLATEARDIESQLSGSRSPVALVGYLITLVR
jgi:hypothetical protein